MEKLYEVTFSNGCYEDRYDRNVFFKAENEDELLKSVKLYAFEKMRGAVLYLWNGEKYFPYSEESATLYFSKKMEDSLSYSDELGSEFSGTDFAERSIEDLTQDKAGSYDISYGSGQGVSFREVSFEKTYGGEEIPASFDFDGFAKKFLLKKLREIYSKREFRGTTPAEIEKMVNDANFDIEGWIGD